jgi:hypothetical protein
MADESGRSSLILAIGALSFAESGGAADLLTDTEKT